MKRLTVIRTPHLGIHAASLTRSRDFTACGLQVSDGERKVARAETVDATCARSRCASRVSSTIPTIG
jgi:hypothetical protein